MNASIHAPGSTFPAADRCIPQRAIAVLIAFAVGGSMMLPSRALADLVDVINPGFEDVSGQTEFNEFTFGVPAGWSLYDPNNMTAELEDDLSFYKAWPVVSLSFVYNF